MTTIADVRRRIAAGEPVSDAELALLEEAAAASRGQHPTPPTDPEVEAVLRKVRDRVDLTPAETRVYFDAARSGRRLRPTLDEDAAMLAELSDRTVRGQRLSDAEFEQLRLLQARQKLRSNEVLDRNDIDLVTADHCARVTEKILVANWTANQTGDDAERKLGYSQGTHDALRLAIRDVIGEVFEARASAMRERYALIDYLGDVVNRIDRLEAGSKPAKRRVRTPRPTK